MLDAVLAVTLAAVLDHAAHYVAQFQRELSSFVAEEQYRQDWTQLPKNGWSPEWARHRELVSDLFLVKVGDDWLQVRDARDMDGLPLARRGNPILDAVRNHEDTASLDPDEVVDLSAAYNLGDFVRTVNTPLFALKFLEAANQQRCRFKFVPDRLPATVAAQADVPGAFRTSTEVWVVEYQERERPTIMRDKHVGGKNVPARGRFWIEADSGRVFMSEIVVDNRTVRATIDVSYQSQPVRGLLLPVEMREWYEAKKTGSKVQTIARYGRFRENHDIQE